MKRFSLPLISMLFLLFVAPLVQAATYYVATTGNDTNPGTQTAPFKTIQKGISTAANGDTIQVASGTYSENISWITKNLTLQGAGAGQSIIDGGGGMGACLSLINVPDGFIAGFTFQNCPRSGIYNQTSSPTVSQCAFSGNSTPGFGGGMNNSSGSSPTVINCTFLNNSAGGSGGGIANGGFGVASNTQVINCIFTNNTASVEGGAMYNSSGGNIMVTGCTFSGNNAGEGGGGMYNNGSNPVVTACAFTNNTTPFGKYGGGIHNRDSHPMVVNCTFSGNNAYSGGGIYNFRSSPAITGCTFSGNNAVSVGGGMYNNGSNPVVTHCVFTNNSGSGGGMENANSSPTVTNCTFRNNNALPGSGGGMSNINGSPLVTNCTFTGNSARNGGGILSSSSNLTVTNCTFSSNSATASGSGMANFNSSLIVINCILWDNGGGEIYTDGGTATVTYSDVQGGHIGAGNINADPLFVNPADGNYRLQSTSPCLNVGSASAPHLPATDLDGGPRLLGGAPDMGAYETWLPAYGLWYVDKTLGSDTTGNGSPLLPFATVTKAITVADNGHSLYIKAGPYGTDRPRITKSLRLFNWLNTGLSRIGQP